METKKTNEVPVERVTSLTAKIEEAIANPVVNNSFTTEKAIDPVHDIVVAPVQELSVDDVREQVNKIQILMKSVMRPDEHYGIIPGTAKPTLYKAGAEKLCFTFRLVPEFEIKRNDMPNGHREYEIKCTLRNAVTGAVMGQGVGSCSTIEKKYRYRNESDFEVTDLPIPHDSKDRKTEYRKQGFGIKKVDGVWVWVKYKSDKAIENPDIADTYNTVLKIGKKRAHVDATISTCAASDIFTQDIEDNLPEIHAPMRNVTPRTEESPQSHPDEASQESLSGSTERTSTLLDPTVICPWIKSAMYGKRWDSISTDGLIETKEFVENKYKGKAQKEILLAIKKILIDRDKENVPLPLDDKLDEYDPKVDRFVNDPKPGNLI